MSLYKEHLESLMAPRKWSDLPVFDIKDRQGHTNYIDFIDIEEMTAPIMTFTDKFHRIGLLLAVEIRHEHVEKRKKSRPVVSSLGAKSTRNTLALFQRYTSSEPTARWSFGWGHSDHFIEDFYQNIHRKIVNHKSSIMACDSCPFVGARVSDELLSSLFHGTNPYIKLVEFVSKLDISLVFVRTSSGQNDAIQRFVHSPLFDHHVLKYVIGLVI